MGSKILLVGYSLIVNTHFLAVYILAQNKLEGTNQATEKASFVTETFLYDGNF